MTIRILLALLFTSLILAISLILQKLRPMKKSENDFIRCLGKCDYEERMVDSLPATFDEALRQNQLVKENRISSNFLLYEIIGFYQRAVFHCL